MTWRSGNYSSADMMTMQQDAVRRVREMQRIANSRLGSASEANSSRETAPKHLNGKPDHPEEPLKPSNSAEEVANQNPMSGILSQLRLDSDRLIILILLIVLLQEGTDQKLLLALCYLLL